MGSTIFLSGSRGGMIAFGVEIAIFLAFVFQERQKQSIAILLSAFLLVSLATIAWTGGREVKARIATFATAGHADLSTDVRLKIDKDILRMFKDHPQLLHRLFRECSAQRFPAIVGGSRARRLRHNDLVFGGRASPCTQQVAQMG